MVSSLDVCQTLGVDRLVNRHLTEDAGALIQHRGLTGGDTGDGVVEFNLPHDVGVSVDVTCCDASPSWDRFGVCADLDAAVEPFAGGFFGQWRTGPRRTDACNAIDGEHFARTDHDGIFFRTDFEYETWLAVLGGFADREAAALTDGKGLGTRVGAEFLALGIDDGAVFHVNLFFQPTTSVAVGDEADVVGIGFLGHREAAFGCFGTDHLFGRRVPKREHRVFELLGGQHTQHIRLVFRVVGGAVKFKFAVFVLDHFGIVPGNNRVEAQRQGTFEQCGEFDALVTAHARVGCPAGSVFIDEIFDDFFLEAFRKVPGVVRDAELFASTPGIRGIFDRAAAARSGAQRARHAREGKVNTDDVVAGIDCACGGNGRVDPARHCGQYFQLFHHVLRYRWEFAVRMEDFSAAMPASAAAR